MPEKKKINQEGTISQNPFDKEEPSKAYSKIDPIYIQSAQAALNFVDPGQFNLAEAQVIDIGSGTGVSAEVLLNAGVKNLSLVEPSETMLQ